MCFVRRTIRILNPSIFEFWISRFFLDSLVLTPCCLEAYWGGLVHGKSYFLFKTIETFLGVGTCHPTDSKKKNVTELLFQLKYLFNYLIPINFRIPLIPVRGCTKIRRYQKVHLFGCTKIRGYEKWRFLFSRHKTQRRWLDFFTYAF